MKIVHLANGGGVARDEWLEARRIEMAEERRCDVCPLQRNTFDEFLTHRASAIHILRTAKMGGDPVAMCVVCRKFAVRHASEHTARPFHQDKLTQMSPRWRNRVSIQVVKFDAVDCTERQREQIIRTMRSAEYMAYMAEHVRLHLPLFRAYQAIPDLIDGLESSPEYSSDEPTDVAQFRTP